MLNPNLILHFYFHLSIPLNLVASASQREDLRSLSTTSKRHTVETKAFSNLGLHKSALIRVSLARRVDNTIRSNNVGIDDVLEERSVLDQDDRVVNRDIGLN